MQNVNFILTFIISIFVPRTKNIWVFGEGDLSVLQPLFEYACSTSDSIKKIYISSNEKKVLALRQRGFDAYYINDFLAYYFIARAKIHFICKTKLSDLNNYLSFNAIKINLFHGIPTKAVGLECLNKKNGAINDILYRRRKNRLRIRYSKYKFFCGTSPYTRRLFSRCFGQAEEKIKITGHPRNDLISGKPINRKYISENLGIDTSHYFKIFSYMPTWRKYEWNHNINFNDMNNFLHSINSILYIRPHHLDSNFANIKDYSNIYILRYENYPLHDSHHDLLGTDILISDYSSITHDYLLTKRPILIYTPDYEAYKTSSKFIVDFKEVIPSNQIFNSKKLTEEMLIAHSGNYCFEKYNYILNLYHSYQDNKSSLRVYNEVKKYFYDLSSNKYKNGNTEKN